MLTVHGRSLENNDAVGLKGEQESRISNAFKSTSFIFRLYSISTVIIGMTFGLTRVGWMENEVVIFVKHDNPFIFRLSLFVVHIDDYSNYSKATFQGWHIH